ncbi:Uncharacterised protein [Canicola haemoglobinophilus]|uniref:Outer membrane protein beta-barrel domain-containing protein n=1 Tax=Canicola haemoglobinophilus TaxID=733 RepID=A0A377HVH3_9PAST|nr:hypothetical protein [Canicola haemoglobinophilus]STO59906.1 Uncharacterised protein [Canicola haemoglobinophilus]
MKINKLFLTVLSVLPAFAIAQTSGFNFYGKAGIDLTSRFESFQIIGDKDINAPNGPYIPTPSKKNTFSPSVFLETTYNVFPKTELGLGIGYIKRKGFKTTTIYDGNSQGEYQPNVHESTIVGTYNVNRYSSLPVYLILKQNYPLNQNTNLYFKGNLGYSFNKIRDTQYDHFTDQMQRGTLRKEDGSSYLSDLKTKNGLYLGLGIGIEYKSFLVELGYYHTNSKITYQNSTKQGLRYTSTSYNNDALRLSVGFKF